MLVLTRNRTVDPLIFGAIIISDYTFARRASMRIPRESASIPKQRLGVDANGRSKLPTILEWIVAIATVIGAIAAVASLFT
jgi:hypothetical protein